MGRSFASRYGVCLVLKGAPTITFSPEGEAFMNPTGNPALSKGGTGDVLTGFIGGLAGQGYGLTEAAFFAAYLHGYIADTYAAGAPTWTCWRGSHLGAWRGDAGYQGWNG